MQRSHILHRDIGVQVLAPAAMHPLACEPGRPLEVNRQSVAAHGGVERLVGELELETKHVAVAGDRRIEIVDQELRRNARELC